MGVINNPVTPQKVCLSGLLPPKMDNRKAIGKANKKPIKIKGIADLLFIEI